MLAGRPSIAFRELSKSVVSEIVDQADEALSIVDDRETSSVGVLFLCATRWRCAAYYDVSDLVYGRKEYD